MLATKDVIGTLNGLLRGEIAATETYNQALEKFPGDPMEETLRHLRDEHREAANTWREHIHQFGGDPVQRAGARGLFARAAQGAAKQFGKKAALKALQQGEDSGLHEYETSLENTDLPMECQALIRNLIPQQREHIHQIDELLSKA